MLAYRKNLLEQIERGDPADARTLSTQVQLGQLLEANNELNAEFLAKRKEIAVRLRTGRALIQAAQQSASEWGTAHSNILTALQERRAVNTESLVQASIEIQKLVNKVREL